MYFIKYHPLKERLRDRTMNDREALPYYILFSVMAALMTALPMGGHLNRWNVLSAFVNTVVVITGIIYCFRQNGGKAGYDFIQKSVVLGWVVMVRLLLPFILCGVAAGFLKIWLRQSCDTTSWIDIVLVVVVEAIYFQRFGRHIRDTTRKSGEQSGSGYRPPAAGSS